MTELSSKVLTAVVTNTRNMLRDMKGNTNTIRRETEDVKNPKLKLTNFRWNL